MGSALALPTFYRVLGLPLRGNRPRQSKGAQVSSTTPEPTTQCVNWRRQPGATRSTRCPEPAIPGQQLCPACAPGRCVLHPAFEADYCPGCGTATVIPRVGA